MPSSGDEPSPQGAESTPDRLRLAVERTLTEAVGSAATSGERTRERAQELVDDVVRRGQEASRELARRSQEARDASSSMAQRVVEAVQDLRLASADEVRGLQSAVDELERRVAALEADPQPEGQAEGGGSTPG